MKLCVSIHMKRLSRKWFAQIMINKLLKKELDFLKQVMKLEYKKDYNLSYNDVITILVNNYKKNKLEFSLEPKLNIVMPFSRHTPPAISSKLDGKTKVSFSLKS